MKKILAFILCLTLILIQFPYGAKTVLAVQQTADFESLGYSNDGKITPINTPIDGFVFCGQTSGGDRGMAYTTNSGQGGSAGVYPVYEIGGVSELSIKRDDNSSFKLTSIWLDACGVGSYKVKIEGYLGDSLVAGCSELNVDITSAVTVSLNWTNLIDEFRITATSQDNGEYDVAATIDNIVYDDLVSPNTAPSISVNNGITLNEGAIKSLQSLLAATDSEQEDSTLVYYVTDLPDNGVLKNNGSTLLLNGTFTQADIDAGSISYTHDNSNTTSDSFTFKVSDGTNELTGQTFNITVTPVNDDPTITGLPTDITVTEDMPGNVGLSAATIYDDSGSSAIALSMISSEGTLSASSGGGVTVSGSGTSTLTLSGTAADIDSYINIASNIMYTGASNVNGNDAATLTLSANDGGNTGVGGGTNVALGTVNIDITAVNDDPTITGLPTDISVVEDVPGNVDLSAAIISDADSGSSSIAFTIAASEGTLSASSGGGVTVMGSGTSTLTLSGTAADIDSYINIASNIMYTGASNVNGNDAATLTLSANDGGNIGAGGGTDVALGTVNIDITAVNDDPIITGLPTDITFTEDTSGNVDLSAAIISDVDSGSSSITLSMTTSEGILSASSGGGVTVSGSGTSMLTLSGTAANIDSYINIVSNIMYTGASNANGNDVATFTVSANDGGNTGIGGGANVTLGIVNIDITAVNDDPTMLGLPTDITVAEDTASNVDLTSVVFNDDSGTSSITLTIAASGGTLSASSGGDVTVTGAGTSTLTLSGTATNIDSYLNTASNIRYTGMTNVYGNDAATLTITSNDGGSTGVGGGADVTFGTVNVDITAVNDVPTLVANAGLSLNEGATAVVTSTQLSATDVETADGLLTYSLTTGSVNGQLENTDNPGVSISGFTQQNIIDGKIQYVHDGSNTTSDSFTFKVSDGMNELTGQTFSITVNAIDDDAPTMVNNMGLTLDQGTDKTITTAELLATDTETADTSIVYTVMDLPDNGELSRGGLVLALSGTFTQQDIIDGKIQYAHDGSTTTSDSFDFKVSDSNANELTGQTFNITINSATIPTPTPIPTPMPTITPSPTQTPGKNTRTINGTLLDEEGNPKVGYVVELHSTPITSITDSQGRYRFDNVNYTAHTLFIKTPLGQQIASFALSFNEGDEFEKSVTGEAADITYTKNTVSVDITIALDGDEDSAEITELSGVDNPATGRTHIWWMLIVAAVLAAGLIGLIVKKRVSEKS